MKALRLILLGVLFALPMSSVAQAPPGEAVTADSMDLNGDGKVDAWEMVKASEKEATSDDALDRGKDVAKAIKNLKDAESPDSTLWVVLVGAIFKLLLSLVKVVGKNFTWFQSDTGKRAVKYSTLALGAAAALCANIVFALPWPDAIEFLLSGPLAVAIHEYSKNSRGASPR